MKQVANRSLLYARFLLGLFFDPEDGGVVFKTFVRIYLSRPLAQKVVLL
jgi:hypothetical protein